MDNKFEKELYRTLHELNTRMAIVMVSHDIGTITSVVKEIVCVNRRVHRHRSNVLTEEQLRNYDCPIQLVSHGHIPHRAGHHPGTDAATTILSDNDHRDNGHTAGRIRAENASLRRYSFISFTQRTPP